MAAFNGTQLAHGTAAIRRTSNTIRATAANVVGGGISHGSGGVVCDHAAPPAGYHYEQTPGTTGSCHLVLRPNVAPASGGSGSGSGSTGTGSGADSGGSTSGGVGTTTGGTTTPSTAVNDQIKAGVIVAVILWAAKHFLKG